MSTRIFKYKTYKNWGQTEVTISALDYRGLTIRIEQWRDIMGSGKRKSASVRNPDGSFKDFDCENRWNPNMFSMWKTNAELFKEGKEYIRSIQKEFRDELEKSA